METPRLTEHRPGMQRAVYEKHMRTTAQQAGDGCDGVAAHVCCSDMLHVRGAQHLSTAQHHGVKTGMW